MKVFEYDFRKGTLTESVNGGVATLSGSAKLERRDKGIGLTINATADNATISFPLTTLYTEIINFRTGKGAYFALVGCTLNGSALHIWNNVGTSQININGYDGTSKTVTFPSTSIRSNTDYQIIIKRNGATVEAFLNNISQTVTGTLGVTESAVLNRLGNRSGNDMGYSGTVIYYHAIYNHLFTEQERANAYRDFLNSYPIAKEKYPNVINKPMDLSREKDNVVGANLIPSLNFVDWSDVGGVSTPSTTSFITSGVGGMSTAPLTIGRKYRLIVKGTTTTNLLRINNSTSANSNILYEISTSTINCDVTFTAALASLYIRLGSIASVSITYFSVQELTGLVAAYNMIPNGSTLVDISGNGGNFTLYDVVTTTKGLKFRGTGTSKGARTALNIGKTHSICLRIKPKALSGRIISGVSGDNYIHIAGATNIYYRAGASSAADFVVPTLLADKEYTLVFTRSGTATVKLYLNGIQTGGDQSIVSNNDFTIDSLSSSTATNPYNGEEHDLKIYNRELSLQEIKNYHNQFVQPSFVCDFSDEGADGVAKVPSGWTKQSGNFKIGEWLIYKSQLITDPTFDVPASWAVTGTWTVSGGKANYGGVGTNRVYQNCNVTVGHRYKVKYTISDATGNAKVYLSNNAGSQVFSGWVAGGNDRANGIYTEELTCVATSATIAVWGYLNGSNFSVDNFTIEEIQPLPTFINGTKYLECVTAGVATIPQKQAYPTVEFDVYKSLDAGLLVVDPIWTANGSGYAYFLNNNEAVMLGKQSGSWSNLAGSVASYIALNTWYRLKLTRNLAGSFTMYIKGGSFGSSDWTLVNMSALGTNPITDTSITTSDRFALSLNAGDRITNITFYDGIKQ